MLNIASWGGGCRPWELAENKNDFKPARWVKQTYKEIIQVLKAFQTFIFLSFLCQNIYIFNIVTLDEALILDVFHFSMKSIEKSCDLGQALGWRYVDVRQ